jgi:transcription termination factor Rho
MTPTIDFEEIKKISYSQLIQLYDSLIANRTEKFAEADATANPREALLFNILSCYVYSGQEVHIGGTLEIVNHYGFLRDSRINFSPTLYDVHLNTRLIEDMGLKPGDYVKGIVEPPRSSTSKLFTLSKVVKINETIVKSDRMPKYLRPHFMALEAIYPSEPIVLETAHNSNFTGRIIDIVAPIGFGQRMLIVAPPKAGKTTVIRNIANSVVTNHPDAKLIILLVGERPEEVTTTRREVPTAEVLSSTFDETAEQQIRVAELCMERAKRLAEMGHKVVLLVDSMSRLVRSYNYTAPSSGKVLSGGVEAYSLYKLRSFFGIARNVTNAGSITMIATCLVDTNSRMDSFIFEELKGTGNSEVYLDVKLAEAQKFPAIDILTSSTRCPESFLSLKKVMYNNLIRQYYIQGNSNNKFFKGEYSAEKNLEHAYNMLVELLRKYRSNEELFANAHNTHSV